mgnify:CR=1 FL=1
MIDSVDEGQQQVAELGDHDAGVHVLQPPPHEEGVPVGVRVRDVSMLVVELCHQQEEAMVG